MDELQKNSTPEEHMGEQMLLRREKLKALKEPCLFRAPGKNAKTYTKLLNPTDSGRTNPAACYKNCCIISKDRP